MLASSRPWVRSRRSRYSSVSRCDEILRRMKRMYTVAAYEEMLARIRATIPAVAVSSDFIVGMNSKLVQDALPFCITDGSPARARGLNLVGLRRAGFNAADIAALKDAYRLLFQRVPLKEAVAQMKKSPSAAVKELAAFLESSKRGFAHPQGD